MGPGTEFCGTPAFISPQLDSKSSKTIAYSDCKKQFTLDTVLLEFENEVFVPNFKTISVNKHTINLMHQWKLD